MLTRAERPPCSSNEQSHSAGDLGLDPITRSFQEAYECFDLLEGAR